MELTSPKTIKEILEKHKAKPLKKFGQNFLIDKNILNKIIESADIKAEDTILEVGPGIGTLTQKLAEKAKKIIAIEKDKTMVEILSAQGGPASGWKNVEIINADILKINLKPYTSKPYKLVANIPYYLTSPLIRKFLEQKNPPKEIVLMIQKEVAQRICAKPPNMSLLAISVQFYAVPKIISYVSKNCFLPSPKIDSAIIKIHPIKYREKVILPSAKLFDGVNPQKKYNIDSDLFFKVVKVGFSQPRKQILGNLSRGLKIDKEKINKWLLENKIKVNQRAETLSVEDWIKLVSSL